MKTNASLMSGIRHGSYVMMTGDTRRLREMTLEAAKSDYVAEAWTEVGKALTQSAATLASQTRINQNYSRSGTR